MVTVTSHVFVHKFQTEHFEEVKLSMDYVKSMGFLTILKSLEVLKKVIKDWTGSFKMIYYESEISIKGLNIRNFILKFVYMKVYKP